jgi:hypothetical protein
MCCDHENVDVNVSTKHIKKHFSLFVCYVHILHKEQMQKMSLCRVLTGNGGR